MALRKLGKTYTEEDFVRAVKNNHSIAGVLRELGLSAYGANYRTVRKLVEKFELDTSHWLGQAHLKGKTHNWGKKRPLREILVENSYYGSSSNLRKRLIKEDLLEEKCYNERCDVKKEWNGKPITLHLDHKNGINNDNRIENLHLLCPNCHSQTETYAGKNIGNYGDMVEQLDTPDSKSGASGRAGWNPAIATKNKCLDCKKEISRNSKRCKSCVGKKRKTKISWPNVRKLIRMVEEKSYLEVGRELGVSDNAVRKRIKNYS